MAGPTQGSVNLVTTLMANQMATSERMTPAHALHVQATAPATPMTRAFVQTARRLGSLSMTSAKARHGHENPTTYRMRAPTTVMILSAVAPRAPQSGERR